MAVGTQRTITRSLTVAAASVRAISALASALPTAHALTDVSADDPGLDVVSISVNGLPDRIVRPTDRVCVILSNATGSPITANVTATLVELGPVPSR